MARVKKSEFRSAWGKAAQVFNALCDEVHNLGGSDDDLRRIETDPALRKNLAKLIVARGGAKPVDSFVESQLTQWIKFYRDVLNVKMNVDAIRIPPRREGFDRLIVVMPGMTPERLFQLCKSRFRGWKYTNRSLDEIVISERTANNGPYAIWIRGRVEPDEELRGKSYNDLKAANIPGVTLEERLLDGLEYHSCTGSHRDISNVTLCSGSRGADGYVPGVCWGGDSDLLGVLLVRRRRPLRRPAFS